MITPEKFGKILTKLPKDKILLKAELEKVELAMKDDVKVSIQKHTKIIQKLRSEIKKAKDLQKDQDKDVELDIGNREKLNKQLATFKSINSTYNKVQGNAEKIAKEVGIQITDIPKWGQFDELWADTVRVMEEGIKRKKTLD
tara:strand:+ start:743 stop:1168 length:426 start_codon:yes stop_codon:yes gene_type:complete